MRRRVKFGLDTSCLIALLFNWHQSHSPTLAEYETRRRRKEVPVIPAHALLESFSVMTRLPAGKGLYPGDARNLLAGNFAAAAEVPDLPGAICWETIEELTLRRIAGGIVYDAVIARSAHQAGARMLLTWNVRDMLRVAPLGLAVRQPGQSLVQ